MGGHRVGHGAQDRAVPRVTVMRSRVASDHVFGEGANGPFVLGLSQTFDPEWELGATRVLRHWPEALFERWERREAEDSDIRLCEPRKDS